MNATSHHDMLALQQALELGRRRPVAVVIGSGFGGLAAAIRLSVKGYDVKVVEKLDGPGGRASVFKQDGFTFDAGPTIITLPPASANNRATCPPIPAEPPVISATLPRCSPVMFSENPGMAFLAPVASPMLAGT